MRGSHTGELVFQDCEVPVENVLGGVGKGVNVFDVWFGFRTRCFVGRPLGIMQACMDVVVPYIHERKQFGQTIGEFQLMQGKIADMYSTMMACKACVYAVGQACVRAKLQKRPVHCAKTRLARFCTLLKKRHGWQAKRFKLWVAMATSTNTQSAACGVMRSMRLVRVPVKSAGCSLVKSCSPKHFNIDKSDSGVHFGVASPRNIDILLRRRSRTPPHNQFSTIIDFVVLNLKIAELGSSRVCVERF